MADIGEAADRLIHISQELLELNRLDEGRDMAQEPVDWTEQVEKIGRMLAPAGGGGPDYAGDRPGGGLYCPV